MSDLVWSIKNGDLDAVKEAIENKSFDINEDINGRKCLHYAADYGQKEVLDYLISKGAEIDALDRHSITPLLSAIWENHPECVKLLLERGASKNGKAPDGTSYLEAAENSEIKALLA